MDTLSYTTTKQGVIIMSYIDNMKAAYLEAAYWTDAEQSEFNNPELTDLFVSEAWSACRNFVYGMASMDIDYTRFNADQVGHDLWLTRNGHGVGFWDRPEIYGKQLSKALTAMAKAQGEHYADFIEA